MNTSELILAANALPVSTDQLYFYVSGYLDPSFSVSDRTHFSFAEILNVSKSSLPAQVMIDSGGRHKGGIDWKIGVNIWKTSSGSIQYQSFVMPDYGKLENGNMNSQNKEWVGVSSPVELTNSYTSVKATVPNAVHLTCSVEPIFIELNSTIKNKPAVNIDSTGFERVSSVQTSTSNNNDNDHIQTVDLDYESSFSANYSSSVEFALSQSRFSSTEESSSESSSESASISISISDVVDLGGDSSETEENTTTIVASNNVETSLSKISGESIELGYSYSHTISNTITVSPHKRVDFSVVSLVLKDASYEIDFHVDLSGEINGVTMNEHNLKTIAEQLYTNIEYASPAFTDNTLHIMAKAIVSVKGGSSLAVNTIVGHPIDLN